ncbi:DUF2357 domain-containing protein [Lentimonas sp. CC4]|uniref:DUF2357 domain-containing protein n=1 Tax=Lentimonas sp. CC4 TaxID=2676099 RepID=UPI001389F98F|nr:DUF2357 domain-containing protein [Lentimonas sp. CC4]
MTKIDGTPLGWWVIEASSPNVSLDHTECTYMPTELPSTWKAKRWANETEPPIRVVHRADQVCIQLKETWGYEWCIECDALPTDTVIQSSLESQNWKVRQNRSGEFKVVNHLGMAAFAITSHEFRPLTLSFEIISRKFDFETEYRQMTEEIAEFCQQLLLSWEAPTSLSFSADSTNESKLLLEQFLFLRHFMNEERLSRLLEAIDRNPHSKLIKESNWVPTGTARSNDYLSDPVRMLRGWQGASDNRRPAEVCDVRKKDTYDTAPNQFIKFALTTFRQLCADVSAVKWKEPCKVSSVGIEAHEMMDALDALLARRFFNEVSRMQRLPLDNQTLQKREGYREVLQAWLLTQAAATLNWEGEQECYSGSTRDVATLYEYWIFIKLHELLKSIDGMSEAESEVELDDFISENNGQLTINLKSGKQSRSRFEWNDPHTALKVDLHYERTFSYNEGATQSGSYSRRFRPDYTLSIFPANYTSEKAAEEDGKVAHLHFDAKYRAEDITKVFGQTEISEKEISEEKRDSKAERTYKRGDLLKMHTYNDALRHTIGSYVLYPGTNDKEAEQLSKFHEIAPGVGAMVMKPGNDACIETLKDFILDVFEHQSDSFSQYRYLSDTSYQTYQDKPERVEEDGNAYNIARKEAPCVFLYMHKNRIGTFKEHGFAYCRVDSANTSKTLNLNLSMEVGSEFIPYGGSLSGKKQTLGWRAKVRTVRFMENSQLHEYIRTKHPTSGITPGKSAHYLVFEFDESTAFKKIDLTKLHRAQDAATPYMAITCSWQDVLTSAEPID